MREIKKSIDKELLKLGFNPDAREFKPHLTLGRVKWVNDKNYLRDVVSRDKDTFFQEIKVNEIIFYESILRAEGPVYKPIEKFILPE
jgi:2'-5' RNA ligase